MLGIIQSQKWKICVPLCLCGLILPQQPDLFNHSPTAFSAVILGQATIDNVPAEEGDWVVFLMIQEAVLGLLRLN